MWCHGPDDFSMWRSQQTSCDDLSAAEIVGLVEIPNHIRFWGIDSGIRHSVGGTDYGSVRIGTFMGLKMIKSWASEVSETRAIELGSDEVEQDDIELLKNEASLDYLCNLLPHRYESFYAKIIPESITGGSFLEKYKNHNDSVTVVDQNCTYGVRAPTVHPIYENLRVKTFKALLTPATSVEQLTALGELLFQCHYSYNACGLGSDGTDGLVRLAQDLQHNAASKSEGGTLFGAKITGGGTGGTVCIIGRNCPKSSEQILELLSGTFKQSLRGNNLNSAIYIFQLQQRYEKATGYLPSSFEGSSPGAGKFGYLKICHRAVPKKC